MPGSRHCVANLFVRWRSFVRIDRKQPTHLLIASYLAGGYGSSLANHSPPICHMEISPRCRHAIATASALFTSIDMWR